MNALAASTVSGNPPIAFFFNDTATTEIYTLFLHDALPISMRPGQYVVWRCTIRLYGLSSGVEMGSVAHTGANTQAHPISNSCAFAGIHGWRRSPRRVSSQIGRAHV